MNLKHKSEITFVIVSLESIKGIKTCLKNIGNDYKVIIAENSNNLSIKNEIENNFVNAKCILLGKNLGYASAANAGISYVKTKFAFLINVDIEIYDYQINELENELNKLENNFSVVSPFYDDFKDFIENNKFDKLFNLNQKIQLKQNIEKVTLVKGSSMLFNLSKFKEKIFDEKFFFFFEEIDVCKRLLSNGEKIYLINNVKISHAGNKSVENINTHEMDKFRNWHYYWSSFYYHKKHYGFYRSVRIHLRRLIKFFLLKNYYIFFNKKMADMFESRFNGLLNSILGKKSSNNPTFGGR